MDLLEPTRDALYRLASLDPALWQIVAVSMRVSLIALALVTPLAVVTGFALAMYRFPGRRLLIVLLQSLLAFPTVVIGLLLYLLLSRRGPLGAWQLLFTQEAMIVGQVIIAFPIISAFTLAAVQAADPRLHETARLLGATELRAALSVLREVRFALIAAVTSGFGRVVSEVGCALMVGGNIAGLTRNIPTAIALETSKGAFTEGIALGIVLMVLALAVNVVLALTQGGGRGTPSIDAAWYRG
ncbi:MAG: ABC transporter permease [Proteobacteria bacterium]|nr:ABC transporter permease [Burkholderiales bacterium]